MIPTERRSVVNPSRARSRACDRCRQRSRQSVPGSPRVPSERTRRSSCQTPRGRLSRGLGRQSLLRVLGSSGSPWDRSKPHPRIDVAGGSYPEIPALIGTEIRLEIVLALLGGARTTGPSALYETTRRSHHGNRQSSRPKTDGGSNRPLVTARSAWPPDTVSSRQIFTFNDAPR
jgi:hypothetical protein